MFLWFYGKTELTIDSFMEVFKMNWSIPVRKVFSVLCNNMKHFLKTRALKEITAV